MEYEFNTDLFQVCISIFGMGIAIGFAIGFIAWAIGLGVYQIIRWIRMS